MRHLSQAFPILLAVPPVTGYFIHNGIVWWETQQAAAWPGWPTGSLHWVITDSHGIGTAQPVITAVAPPYAFNVSMTWGATTHPGGQLQMGASSVCLWPHGAPSPGQ